MKPAWKFVSLNCLLILIISACGPSADDIRSEFSAGFQGISDSLVADKALAVARADLIKENDIWSLTGESTIPEVHAATKRLADSLLGGRTFEDHFALLPHKDLGDSTAGLIRVSVANLREFPKHSAQLVDQGIMGNTIRLLKRKGGWYLIQTHYGYIGWMTASSFKRMDQRGMERWQAANLCRVEALVSYIYSDRSEQSQPVCDVVFNATLKLVDRGQPWSVVETPDGRIGFIRTGHIKKMSSEPLQPHAARIIKTARRLTGTPYLWGGNSSKGSDCSGFTQTVFRANGLQLPRDARQQVLMGSEIVPDSTFSNVLPGDLLFFGMGDRITHVAISLGGYDFIHQDSDVNIASLDRNSARFNAYRRKSLRVIKRVIE